MKIIYDKNIPFVEDYFSRVALPSSFKGYQKNLINQAIKNYEILLTRTVIKVNQELLDNTNIRIVGSATAGYDHVDLNYLKKNKIKFFNSKGCNSHAVKEYVLLVVLKYLVEYNLDFTQSQIGIIGLGHVGSELLKILIALGVKVLVYDPLLNEKKKKTLKVKTKSKIIFVEKLEEIFKDKKTNIVTLHVPLTYEGDYSTYEMINSNILKATTNNLLLINTSRGATIEEKGLLRKILRKEILFAGDVWVNEPMINHTLMINSFFSTPHIAGYTQEAKHQATYQIYKQITKYCLDKKLLNTNDNNFFKTIYTKKTFSSNLKTIKVKLEGKLETILYNILLSSTGLVEVNKNLKKINEKKNLAKGFSLLRKSKYRRELCSCLIQLEEVKGSNFDINLLLEILKILNVSKSNIILKRL